MRKLKAKTHRKNNKIFALLFCAFLAAILFSCRSVPKNSELDFLSVIDGDAPLIIFIPVRANSDFVQSAIVSLFGISQNTARQITERTDNLMLAISSSGAVQLAANGNFPSVALKAVLTEKNGWTKASVNLAKNKYSYYKNTDFNIEFSLYSSFFVFASSDITPMFARFEEQMNELFTDFADSDSKASYDLSDFLYDDSETKIKFYSSDPAFFAKFFIDSLGFGKLGNTIGIDLNFGIKTLKGTLLQSETDSDIFEAVFELEMTDTRALKAAIALLKLMFHSSFIEITQIDVSTVQISDFMISQSQIIKLIPSK